MKVSEPFGNPIVRNANASAGSSPLAGGTRNYNTIGISREPNHGSITMNRYEPNHGSITMNRSTYEPMPYSGTRDNRVVTTTMGESRVSDAKYNEEVHQIHIDHDDPSKYGATVVVQQTPQLIGTQIIEKEPYMVSEKLVDTDKTHMVQKKVLIEDTYERTVQEDSQLTEYTESEEEVELRERIVEIEQDVIKKVVRENRAVVTVEELIEVPQKVVYEKLVYEDDGILGSTAKSLPHKVVEVPQTDVIHVRKENIVEVPYYREEVVLKELPVPQQVIKEVPQYITKEVHSDKHRKIPLPIEQVTVFEFVLPSVRPQYEHVSIPMYVPRFVEVPFPNDLMDPAVARHAEHFVTHLNTLTEGATASLCEVENLAASITATEFRKTLSGKDTSEQIYQNWQKGMLKIDHKSWEKVSGESGKAAWNGSPYFQSHAT